MEGPVRGGKTEPCGCDTVGSMSRDGQFQLYYRKGWAYLSVEAPQGNGRPVYSEEVENRMKVLRVPRVSGRTIREIVEAADGQPVALVEWPDGRSLAAAVTVSVAEDGMTAWVSVAAPRKGAAPPTVEDVLDEVHSEGVLFGVDRAAVISLLATAAYGVKTVIARGAEPVAGRGAAIHYHFNTNRGRPYLEMEFGRINLKELNFIDFREEDDLLAELLPPVTPVDGRTVNGTTIPAPMDDRRVELAAGANTRLSPDRTQLFAATDGNVRIRANRVIVEPVIVVKNVNYETGNIHFDGSVVVEESIADGFIVEAGGDIQVGKGVGRSTLKAGGSVLLKTGINANGAGEIECGGDLFARYIESCSVTCHGNVIVEEAVMHSTLRVWGHCVLTGRRAEFIAGDIVLGGSFWCKKLGNLNEVATRVAIGVEPNVVLTYRTTRSNLDEKQDELDTTEQKIEQIARAIRDGHDDEKLIAALRQLQAAAENLRAEIGVLRSRLPGLRDQLAASRSGMLVAEDTIFHGVVITFGRMEFRVSDQGARKTILRAGEFEVIESGFDHRNRPTLDF